MAPHGDAGVALNEQIKMGPISTLTGCYLSQFIIGEMVELLLADGNDAPVFRSSNMDGADEYNQVLFDKYVIKLWNKQATKNDTIYVVGDLIDCHSQTDDSCVKKFLIAKKYPVHKVQLFKFPLK